MKRYRISPSETSYYYSTCTISAWIPLFHDEPFFKIIIDSLNYCRIHKGLLLLGYVIMPTHLHLITSNTIDTTLSEILRDFKAYTSKKIRELLEQESRTHYLKVFKNAAKTLRKQTFKIWQDDFHPVALTSDKWFHQKMEYLHNNPVRKGFVELPEHWKYSSARNWLLDDDTIITIDRHALS
jgi:REP element-mobilizing transposase RayT